MIAKKRDYEQRKIARCPSYKRLLQLRTKRWKLQQVIERYRELSVEKERKLIEVAREIVRLEKETQGK
jgi:hypothetical protein